MLGFFVKCVLRIPRDTKPISFLAVYLKFKKRKAQPHDSMSSLSSRVELFFPLPDAAFPAVGKP